jgi:hypothetical protein
MAEAKEKDNFVLYVGIAVVCTVVLALLLKQDEVKHLKTSPELTKEQVTKKNTHPGNKFTE